MRPTHTQSAYLIFKESSLLRAHKQFEKSLKSRHESGQPLTQSWFEKEARNTGVCPQGIVKQFSNEGKIVRHSRKRFFPVKLAL